ncbi:MAG: aminotransferase class III-fold pyridoxal phosphate-dependent enzyme [Clostridia bacterium]|nr:aminotransferase class III-fold pyridoxal phosphate-dependent enzyme [Clostridia bacterium]
MFQSTRYSLTDLLGKSYPDSVIDANCFFEPQKRDYYQRLASEKVDFYPIDAQKRDDELLPLVGTSVIPACVNENDGAATDSFRHAFHRTAAPLTGRGCTRIGEDGRLYFVGKSEHYHASLGHGFPGYRLIDHARALGILNATHNNTRGFITRTLERELIRAANGIARTDDAALQTVLASRDAHVLNRVISLETGSLAVEAALKMMLNRFYRQSASEDARPYAGRIPVFFVMADRDGGNEANYHGTTVIAQTLRGMWPEIADAASTNGLYKVVSVAINDIDDFREKIEAYNKPPYKTAGFLHEIILMNYAGIRLHKAFLQQAYALCRAYDTPTLADEIQSCVWYRELYLFRRYELTPDFVIIGKGFSGGEYPASKVLTTAEMDSLTQFGALVTNGQEELASLSYLITMRFVQDNAEVLDANQAAFEQRLNALAQKYPALIDRAEGLGYLAALVFHDLHTAADFAKRVNACCIDVSAQTYKANCPPAVLIKLPLITSPAGIDFVADTFEAILAQL